MLKILLVDDHNILRAGLISLIKTEVDCHCFEANNGIEALKIVSKEKIDLVILDVEMPVMNGRDTFLKLRKLAPDIKILILTYLISDETFLYFVYYGANGFLQKDLEPSEMFEAVSTVLSGEKYYPDNILKIAKEKLVNITREVEKLNLNPREIQLIKEMKKGNVSKIIAGEMGLTTKTIHTYRERLLNKTETKNAVELIAFAARNGLLKF